MGGMERMGRLGLSLVGVLASLSVWAGSRAHASDVFGFAVGTGLGVHQSASPNNAGDDMMLADLNVRLRFLWILGFDLRFNLQNEEAVVLDDAAQYAARYRSTLMLHVIPTSVASLWVGGGLGATEGKDLFNPRGDGSSYHAGLGLEIPVAGKLVLDASFMLLIPGEKSLERDLDRRVDLELAAYRASGSNRLPNVPSSLPTSDYVSLSNYELMLRAMMSF